MWENKTTTIQSGTKNLIIIYQMLKYMFFDDVFKTNINCSLDNLKDIAQQTPKENIINIQSIII